MKSETWAHRLCSMGAWVALLLCASPASAQEPAPGSQDRSTVDAARLYDDACGPCHGPLGDGKGRGVQLLGPPPPRDFTTGVFKFRSTPAYSRPTDQDLYHIISRGVPGTWMPAWEDLLAPAERWALIRYIKGFSPLVGQQEPDPPVEIPAPPGASPDLVQEGRWVYAVLQCGQCHGPQGRGDGPSADELTDDWDQPIRAYDFTRGYYKNGSTPADLYRTLVTGLSGTPMPALDRDNLTFPGGPEVDIAPMRKGLDPESSRGLEAYAASQPTATDLETMPGAKVEKLVQHRLWALVYYLRSLSRPSGLFHWLFGENPELQARAGAQ